MLKTSRLWRFQNHHGHSLSQRAYLCNALIILYSLVHEKYAKTVQDVKIQVIPIGRFSRCTVLTHLYKAMFLIILQ